MPSRKPKSPTRLTRKALRLGVGGRGTREPEADEQVGHQSHRLPAEEQLQEIVRHHQHQHREGEQRDVAEKPLVTGIVVHVADGVDVHHERNEGDHAPSSRRQRVDQEADLRAGSRRRRSRCRPRHRSRAPPDDLPQRHRGGGERDRPPRRWSPCARSRGRASSRGSRRGSRPRAARTPRCMTGSSSPFVVLSSLLPFVPSP